MSQESLSLDKLAKRIITNVTLALSVGTNLCSLELTYLIGGSLTESECTDLARRISDRLAKIGRSFLDTVEVREIFTPQRISGSRIIVKVAHTGNYQSFHDAPI